MGIFHRPPLFGYNSMFGNHALPVWRPLLDVVGVGRACHRPQLDTIDKDSTAACPKKSRHITTADLPRAVNLFDKMPEQARAPT
jgi:hypothetical protein